MKLFIFFLFLFLSLFQHGATASTAPPEIAGNYLTVTRLIPDNLSIGKATLGQDYSLVFESGRLSCIGVYDTPGDGFLNFDLSCNYGLSVYVELDISEAKDYQKFKAILLKPEQLGGASFIGFSRQQII